MSHYIEDRQVAVELDMTETLGDRKVVLLIAEGGDNNVSQMLWRGNRHYEVRAKDWGAVSFGTPWRAMTQLVERAASCEGGMLVLARVRPTLPETYIRRWRAAVEAPVTLPDVAAAGITIAAALRVDESGLRDHQRETYARLRSAYPGEEDGAGVRKFAFDLANPDHVAALHTYYGLAGDVYPWSVFKVTGPREAVVRRSQARARVS